jgi:hypothetical protein
MWKRRRQKRGLEMNWKTERTDNSRSWRIEECKGKRMEREEEQTRKR